jgi:hypothetical protein
LKFSAAAYACRALKFNGSLTRKFHPLKLLEAGHPFGDIKNASQIAKMLPTIPPYLTVPGSGAAAIMSLGQRGNARAQNSEIGG